MFALAASAAAGQPRVPALPAVTAVQVNIDRGGRYETREGGAETWGAAKGFARELQRRAPLAAIVGMQEVDSDATATKIRDLLAESTKGPWTYLWASQGVADKGDGLAILWRTDRVSLEKDLGQTPIDFLDDGTILRFIGGWFRQVESGRAFGFFTGKLASPWQERGAHPVTKGTQRQEAWRVREWIREVMLPHPDDARIVAVDMQSSFGSPAWFELHEDFETDGDKRLTFCSFAKLFKGQRYDYLWWDGNSGPRTIGGVVGKAGRSEHFGGAHRFVWAALKL